MKKVAVFGSARTSPESGLYDEMLDNGFLNNDEMKLIHYVDRFSEATHLLKGLLR